MEWIADPSVGEWLRERIDESWDTMHRVIPRGFPAYARVFHPGRIRALPDGEAVPTFAEWEQLSDQDRQRLSTLIIDDSVTWTETATAFDTTMHPLVVLG